MGGKHSAAEEIEHSRDQEEMVQLVALDEAVLCPCHRIHHCSAVVGGLKLLVELGSLLNEIYLVAEMEV